MTEIDRAAHWNSVYASKAPSDLSWFQRAPAVSLELIEARGVGPGESIIDIGAGASSLVDHLLERGFEDVSCLDISEAALAATRARLGDARSSRVEWIVADVTRWRPQRTRHLWHDRATFHFLTSEAQRAAYAQVARAGVHPGGHLILGAFAPDGPTRCSDLDVFRPAPDDIRAIFADGFDLITDRSETHTTPWGKEQRFAWYVLQRR